RRIYNQVRPHSSLGYRPPAPEALLPADPIPVLVGLT
ncbi:MAG: integrase core domain-containing protein, partial [Caldilineaceae bacterium]|nr:integrase core domain-containing protein [Caldilineaceae bacterium]MCY4409499.1 integrase core domain-containing protein [Caldilineaceae bacterium]MCY4409511.1 integrase core domain-containing protein [Caldilineaceae bacterium]MCY4410419.1 integrase core domain-containing protein [Caldilineaceae bacterium]MCY4413289.1 integrase core domain-containing protein [Caldilineaceae bacterium]